MRKDPKLDGVAPSISKWAVSSFERAVLRLAGKQSSIIAEEQCKYFETCGMSPTNHPQRGFAPQNYQARGNARFRNWYATSCSSQLQKRLAKRIIAKMEQNIRLIKVFVTISEVQPIGRITLVPVALTNLDAQIGDEIDTYFDRRAAHLSLAMW